MLFSTFSKGVIMPRTLLVVAEGSPVSIRGKKYMIQSISESEGSVSVHLKSGDSEVIALVIAQKTGKEYWGELQATLREFGEKAGGKLSELATDATADFKSLLNALGQLNLTKRAKGAISDIVGKKK